jgi:hypothetical protein
MEIVDGIEIMGRNEYARHRGDTPNAVAKAEKSGRITSAVKRDAAGIFLGIDWRKADELWALNTDPEQALRSGKVGAPAALSSAPGDQLDLQPGAEAKGEQQQQPRPTGDKDPHGYLEARGQREQYQAKQAELDYLEALGLVIATEEVREAMRRRYGMLRTKLENIADRFADEVAAERDPSRVRAIINAEIKRVLNELSNDASTEAAGGVAERMAA